MQRNASLRLAVFLVLAGCLSWSAACGAPEALRGEWSNLEGEWRFRTDPAEVGEKEGWQQPGLDDADWRVLQVPGSWESQGVTEPRPGEEPRPKDGMPWSDYDGVGWYRLRVTIPQAWAGKDLALELGSIDDQDRTFLNGELVGETGEGVDRAVLVWRHYKVPTALVKPGEENVLAIRVLDGGGPGGINGPMLTLLPEDLAASRPTLPVSDRPLAERFADPPADCRILKIIHPWPEAPREQDATIRSLIGQGFGGVVCNVSFDKYLESEEHWTALKRAADEAKQAGMALWLYDEKGYPSGNAGGLTMGEHPEWEARGLLIADAKSEGGEVELPVPPGRLVQATAYPAAGDSIDLAGGRDLANSVAAGKLKCALPPGEWRVMVITEDRLYDGTHAANSLGDKLPYINLLMPEPTARFIELTHQRYSDHLGPDLGKFFAATFTDEPSLMSWFIKPMPYRPLPWSPNLPGEFEKRRGYALEPLIPALVAGAGPRGERVRYDYWLTVGELVSEGFFGQIQAWCRAHGIPSGGHLLCEESLLLHVALYGDFMRCVRRLDAPSMDCLTSIPAQVPFHVARLISSAAELEGRPLTMCETSDFVQVYRPEGDERPVVPVTADQTRGTCNRLLAGGIHTITSYYTFQGLTGAHLRELNQWVGRCSTALRGGHQVADIGLVYPIESVWPRFAPSCNGETDSPSAKQVAHTWRLAADGLYNARRDFTWLDSRTLAEARVEDGALAYRELRWRVVVLPRTDTLPLAAWENLAALWRSGGVVVALGALPRNSETEFPSAQVAAIAKELFGEAEAPHVQAGPAGGAGIFLPDGTEALLAQVLDGVLERDVSTGEPRSPLRATHRAVDGHEVYFLINDSDQPWEGEMAVAGTGQGEQWDPATGKMTPLDGSSATLKLGAYGATILRFPTARERKRLPLATGPLPGMALRDLPAVAPSCGKGEFVNGDVTPDRSLGVDGRPVWGAVGTLTKSKVDTFMFLGLKYPQSPGMSDALGLQLESWVPEGQATPANLLVILVERGGGQYLADTGRPLALAGRRSWFVPFDRFEPAGWAKDPDGRLDLDAVEAMSIGWGGYFGTEGETIAFSLANPQLVVCGPGG